MSEAFDKGVMAALNKESAGTNPYEAGMVEWEEWGEGYYSAIDVDEDGELLDN